MLIHDMPKETDNFRCNSALAQPSKQIGILQLGRHKAQMMQVLVW